MDLRAALIATGVFLRQPLTPSATALVTVSLVATLAGGQLTLDHFWPKVTISDSHGLVRTVRCSGTVADALALADVQVGAYDGLSAAPEMRVPNLHRIHIRRAVPVTITTASGDFEIQTLASDISDLKSDPRLDLGPLDRLWPRSGTPIQPGMTIKLARVTTTESTERETVAPPVDFVHDPSLPRGASVLSTKGKPGLQEVRVISYFKDGVFSGVQKLPGTILKAAVPEIRKIGVRALAMSRGARGNRVLTMESTAYEPGPQSCGIYADGYTATGHKATYGVCAVDPRVIPLGTRLFIEGYGIALACDTGGAIKGLKIDVCFDTVPEAMRWGRKMVKVYILDDIGGTTIPIVDKKGKTQKLVAVSVAGTGAKPDVVVSEVPATEGDPIFLPPANIDEPSTPMAPPVEPLPAAPPADDSADTVAPIDLLPPPINLLPVAVEDEESDEADAS